MENEKLTKAIDNPIKFSANYDEATGEFTFRFTPQADYSSADSKPGQRALNVCELHSNKGMETINNFMNAILIFEEFAAKQDDDYEPPQKGKAEASEVHPDRGEESGEGEEGP